jgi:choline dehydrogenase-like flavoprotein
MLVDSRRVEGDEIAVDVCIVGTGPAGLSLAQEFLGHGATVCLLESGGLAPEPEAQDLADGLTVGEPIHPPRDVCRRQLGGNSNAWVIRIARDQLGVRYTPLDAVDFETRNWLPYSGWPITYDDLIPYYHRAQKVCRSGPFQYQPNLWESPAAPRLGVDPARVETGMFQFGPSATFFDSYRQAIAEAPNITLYHHATVVELETHADGGIVSRVRVSRPGGDYWVRARQFVLACGGFENARLLLLSNRQQPAGLGNQHDVVGRYFHDHPFVLGGSLVPYKPALFNQTGLYDLRWVNGVPAMGHLKLSRAVLEQEQLLNISASFFPRPSRRKQEAILALQQLVQGLATKQVSWAMVGHLGRMLGGADHIAQTAYWVKTKHQPWLTGFSQGGWSAMANNHRRFKSFEVIHQIEQTPEPTNRVTLSRDRDVLGCPKLEVHWRWNLDDAHRIGRAQAIFADALADAGLGEFQVAQVDGLPVLGRPSGAHHLMGTTRMSDNPKFGVVDAHCQVHGLSNLAIAGSSVFPTGGYSNPTLTIVALALRLGDRLKRQLG